MRVHRQARLRRFQDLLTDLFAFAASVPLLLMIPRVLELLDTFVEWMRRQRPLPKSPPLGDT